MILTKLAALCATIPRGIIVERERSPTAMAHSTAEQPLDGVAAVQRGRPILGLAARIAVAAVGVVNAMPVAGIAGHSALEWLYGVDITGSDLLVMMRHRAVLLGILGIGLILAGLLMWMWETVVAANLVAMATFVIFVGIEANVGADLTRVAIIDLVGIAALLSALILERVGRRPPARENGHA